MFLIMGVNNKNTILNELTLICPACGSYGKFKVIMNYSCFSLFFIPLFKWNKRYFAISSCCNTNYLLTQEATDKMNYNPNYKIQESDLIVTQIKKRCPSCHKLLLDDVNYCPHCGTKID